MKDALIINEFSFTNLTYGYLILIIPILGLLINIFCKNRHNSQELTSFADKELLPHLVKNADFLSRSRHKFFLLSLFVIFSSLALMGPRWGFREVQTFTNGNNLVILIDLSQSMKAEDENPSRIIRAKQEIEDILKFKDPTLKVSLIGFASIPHLISPLTDDIDTINNLLPYINTNLVNIEGSDLNLALQMANKLLKESENGSILVLSDGGFDSKIEISSQFPVSFLGFGSAEGAPISNSKGNLLKKDGNIIISKLQDGEMKRLAKQSGQYIKANFLENDTKSILNKIDGDFDDSEQNINKIRHYNEIFYIPLSLAIFILLFFFRKGTYLIAIVIFLSMPETSQASIFKNLNQRAKEDYDNKKYKEAADKFIDNYKKGVAQYRAGEFDKAAQSFQNVQDNDIQQEAEYNLGNSLFNQNKFTEAVEIYESLLKENPNHSDAKFNLNLAQKMKKNQQENNSKDKNYEENNSDKNKDNKENTDKSKDPKNDDNTNDKSTSDSQNKNDDQESSNENNENSDKESMKDHKEEKEKEGEDSMQNSKKNEPQKTPERQKLDFSSDQQLNRIEGNPANILKNQFYIEEQIFKRKSND